MSTLAPVPKTSHTTDSKPIVHEPIIDLSRNAQDHGWNWVTTIALSALHIGAVVALFFFTWKAFAVFCVTYVLGLYVGIGMCYHRLLTHRGYRVPRWLERCFAVLGCLSLQGGPIFWVATHRVHHQLTDKPGDPHSPHDGGWWAHVGWILRGDALHHHEVLLERYAPDLVSQRFYRVLSRFHWVPLVILGLALLWFGGWPSVLWGICLRVTLSQHSTWLVNSVTHMWGSRRFSTKDESRNNFLIALITGGEGWHNNHHAHPVSARHGLAWYEWDPNFYGIWLLEKLGLATRVNRALFDWSDPRPARSGRYVP
ncbi:MAG: fatty acid desaturase [Edaphobacter sp.]|uniref:acyl-CoA desaturase n=1 Tax=Edaphobacter sp. TaxID=1934404 RepID=UPI0023A1321C|nr:fatty acid desaturase [Edaphobacter sp.]MDE1175668.1 fatty acid desaturase [Edaphobacter sp.]